MTESTRREWRCPNDLCRDVVLSRPDDGTDHIAPQCPFCGSAMVDPTSPRAWLHQELLLHREPQRLSVSRVDNGMVVLDTIPISHQYELEMFRAALAEGKLTWVRDTRDTLAQRTRWLIESGKQVREQSAPIRGRTLVVPSHLIKVEDETPLSVVVSEWEITRSLGRAQLANLLCSGNILLPKDIP